MLHCRTIPFLITWPEDPSRLSAAIAYLNTCGSSTPPTSSAPTSTNSFCVGGGRRRATTKSYFVIASESSKVLIGYCSSCDRKKSMTVSDNTIQVEGLSDFFKNLRIKGLNVSKKMARDVLKNPGKALKNGANVGTAFTSRSPKAALSSLPEVINF